jgi:osmotically-inducible protein OsmY
MAKLSMRRNLALAATALLLMLAGGPFPARGQNAASDEGVRARVEQKFMKEGLLVGNDIHVTVENRTVTLTGNVRTLAQAETARKAAESEAKGYKVMSRLEAAGPDRPIRQIAESIMSAIDKYPSYYIFDSVGVGIDDAGVTTLKGWTYYPWSAEDFVKIAENQPGVTKIKNEITRLMSMSSDTALRFQVARLIYRRPLAASFARMSGPIHIIVNNSVVTLVGTVRSESDRSSYEQMVRSNTGALNVINELRVSGK